MITATGSRRILHERSGNVAGSCRKAPEIAGSGSSIPTGNLLDFFRWIPVDFLCFPAGTGRKSSEKIRKFSGGNTASTFQRFPVLSCRNRPVIFDLGAFQQIIKAIEDIPDENFGELKDEQSSTINFLIDEIIFFINRYYPITEEQGVQLDALLK
jgi:hypothetical protein